MSAVDVGVLVDIVDEMIHHYHVEFEGLPRHDRDRYWEEAVMLIRRDCVALGVDAQPFLLHYYIQTGHYERVQG